MTYRSWKHSKMNGRYIVIKAYKFTIFVLSYILRVCVILLHIESTNLSSVILWLWTYIWRNCFGMWVAINVESIQWSSTSAGCFAFQTVIGVPLLVSSSLQGSNLGSPALYPSWSAPLLVSSGCAGPPSVVVPLVQCSTDVSSHSMEPRWCFSHACSAKANFLSSLSHSHPSVPVVCLPVSVWSLQCKPGHSCRGYL